MKEWGAVQEPHPTQAHVRLTTIMVRRADRNRANHARGNSDDDRDHSSPHGAQTMHADMSAINPTKTLTLAIRSIIVLLAAFSAVLPG